MVTFNKFRQFSEDLSRKVHNLNADTLKIMLVNSPAPVNTNTVKGDLTEIAAGNGYLAGGVTLTGVSATQVAGVMSLVAGSPQLTATGAIGPFRYAVLYNDTATGDPLIGWWDYGSSITMANGDVLDITFGASVLTLT